ncbi:Bgt-51936 [Blumeria graminis f. sp. tritici]|uniref:Bgt-51936 n=1 Tax=Blumeria graminis f. sp. tritici TaxID=62690 RepID=A0A9X9L6X0_BLUGR|nr:Bgt-51936 [Blumeria graminis f. sp. tritici]
MYRCISSAPKGNQYGRPWISYSGAITACTKDTGDCCLPKVRY